MKNIWLELNKVKKEFPIGCIVELTSLISHEPTINFYKNKTLTILNYEIGKYFIYLRIKLVNPNGIIGEAVFNRDQIKKRIIKNV